MGYIENAPQIVQEFARQDKEFLEYYESDSEFRELANMMVNWNNEKLRCAKEILEKEQE